MGSPRMPETRHQKPGEPRSQKTNGTGLPESSGLPRRSLQPSSLGSGSAVGSEASLAPVPIDVHALEADPALVDSLALEELAVVLERCAVEHERLAVVERLTHARLRRELADFTQATEGLLTATDAARVLGVPKSYVLELGRRGDLPRVTMGKYVRFRPADLATYIAAHVDR